MTWCVPHLAHCCAPVLLGGPSHRGQTTHIARHLLQQISRFTWRVGYLVRRPILRTTSCTGGFQEYAHLLAVHFGSVFSPAPIHPCRTRSASQIRERHECFVCEMTACVLAHLQTHVAVDVDVHPRLCFCGHPYYHCTLCFVREGRCTSRVLVASTRGLRL